MQRWLRLLRQENSTSQQYSPVLCKLSELAIKELVSIERDNQLSPWSAKHFEAEFGLASSHVLGARSHGKLHGFIVYRLEAHEAHILNLCIVKESRRRGYAQNLLRYALQHVESNGLKSCYLEVRASNVAAQRLYEGVGFDLTGHRKNYYQREGEDALVFSWNLRDDRPYAL